MTSKTALQILIEYIRAFRTSLTACLCMLHEHEHNASTTREDAAWRIEFSNVSAKNKGQNTKSRRCNSN